MRWQEDPMSDRNRCLRVAVVGGLFGLLVVAGPVVAASSASVKITEADERYLFSPATTSVSVGGTVTWTNGSDADHNVTSESGSELGSPTIAEGATFHHTFDSTGTFAYHCTIHGYMVGSVVVLAAGGTAPPTDVAGATSAGTGESDPRGGWVLIAVVALGGAALASRRLRPDATN
jgi:plastocyanin